MLALLREKHTFWFFNRGKKPGDAGKSSRSFLAELVIHNGTFLLPHARGSESLAPVRIDNSDNGSIRSS
jgi:hypothetical protein